MTNQIDSQQFESYIPVYDEIPEKWEESRPFLVEQLKGLANAVNIRQIGWFLDEELISGKQFIPSPNTTGGSDQFRTILRKVIDFGQLPNAGTKSVAHGITVDIYFTLMNLYISATDPINFLSFGLQNWDITGTSSIILNMDATNINVTTTADYSDYTRSYVVVEYIQEL